MVIIIIIIIDRQKENINKHQLKEELHPYVNIIMTILQYPSKIADELSSYLTSDWHYTHRSREMTKRKRSYVGSTMVCSHLGSPCRGGGALQTSHCLLMK